MTSIGTYSPLLFAILLDYFVIAGSIYFTVAIIFTIRWWNGSNEGNTK